MQIGGPLKSKPWAGYNRQNVVEKFSILITLEIIRAAYDINNDKYIYIIYIYTTFSHRGQMKLSVKNYSEHLK